MNTTNRSTGSRTAAPDEEPVLAELAPEEARAVEGGNPIIIHVGIRAVTVFRAAVTAAGGGFAFGYKLGRR